MLASSTGSFCSSAKFAYTLCDETFSSIHFTQNSKNKIVLKKVKRKGSEKKGFRRRERPKIAITQKLISSSLKYLLPVFALQHLEFKIFRHSLFAPTSPNLCWGSDSFIKPFWKLFCHFRRGERTYTNRLSYCFSNFKMSDEPYLAHEVHSNQWSHKPFATTFSILELVHFPETLFCQAKCLCKSGSTKLSTVLHAINLNSLIEVRIKIRNKSACGKLIHTSISFKSPR